MQPRQELTGSSPSVSVSPAPITPCAVVIGRNLCVESTRLLPFPNNRSRNVPAMLGPGDSYVTPSSPDDSDGPSSSVSSEVYPARWRTFMPVLGAWAKDCSPADDCRRELVEERGCGIDEGPGCSVGVCACKCGEDADRLPSTDTSGSGSGVYGGGLPGSDGSADVLAADGPAAGEADENTKGGGPEYAMPDDTARGRVDDARCRWLRARRRAIAGWDRWGVGQPEELVEGGDDELLFSAVVGVGVRPIKRTEDALRGA